MTLCIVWLQYFGDRFQTILEKESQSTKKKLTVKISPTKCSPLKVVEFKLLQISNPKETGH